MAFILGMAVGFYAWHIYAHARFDDLGLDVRSQWVGSVDLSTSKQAISIKVATKVGLFFLFFFT